MAPMKDSPRFPPRRILLVDDEIALLNLLKTVLERNGYEVLAANGGIAALHILRDTQSDVIVSDLRMPGMSGFELLSIVSRRFPLMATVALTGRFEQADDLEGLIVDAVVQKGISSQPVMIAGLIASIEKAQHALSLRAPASHEVMPIWIPRRDSGYILITCHECLRAFPVADGSHSTELRHGLCVWCDARVSYHVDDSMMIEATKRKSQPVSISSGRPEQNRNTRQNGAGRRNDDRGPKAVPSKKEADRQDSKTMPPAFRKQL